MKRSPFFFVTINPRNFWISFLLAMSIFFCSIVRSLSLSISTSTSTEEMSTTKDANSSPNISIAGYLPDYRSSIHLNRTVPHLTDLILFSLEVHSRGMVGGCCLQKDHYQKARIAKQYYNSNLNLWVTVGGQGRASGWQDVCHDPTKRNRFIESMMRLCAREGIQGIDLDWFSSIRTPQDKHYFLEFLKEARPLWYKQGMLKLSIPLHVGQTLPRWAYDLIDRIHLMVYDSPSVTSQPKIETEQLRITYAQRGIDYLIQSGCPPQKIWLGIPFFGSKLDAPGITMTFHEALENQKESSSSMSLDGMEELFNGYQWDSPSVIGEKITFVKEHALGGVFIWELGQDSHSSKKESAGTLLETMVAMSRNFVSSQRNDEL